MTVTAIVTVLGALGTFLGVIATLIVALRTKTQTQIIHTNVNSNLKAMTTRVEQLTTLLSHTGMDIPPATYPTPPIVK